MCPQLQTNGTLSCFPLLFLSSWNLSAAEGMVSKNWKIDADRFDSDFDVFSDLESLHNAWTRCSDTSSKKGVSV